MDQSAKVREDSSDSDNFQRINRSNADDERVSWVYRRGYATREVVPEGGFRIHCLRKNCNKSFRTKDGSTSNIRRHLNRKHGKYEKPEHSSTTTKTALAAVAVATSKTIKEVSKNNKGPSIKKIKIIPTIVPQAKTQKVDKPPEDLRTTFRLIELCLLSHIPFKAVEQPPFSTILKSAIVIPTLPTSQQLLQFIPTFFKDKSKEIIFLLQQQSYISVSCNIWSSPYSNNFLSVTAHFIDLHWIKREVLVGFENLEASYSGVQLAQKLLCSLDNFGITNQLFSITTDSSIHMKEMITTITEVASRRGDFKFIKPRQHILCLGEVIDYSAQSAIASALGYASLEGPPGISQPITASLTTVLTTPLTKICAALAIIKQHGETHKYFSELWQTFYQKRPILISDVVKRWGATYSLIGKVIETVDEYNAACLKSELGELQLSQADCNFLKELHSFLKHFFVLTVFLSTTRYPTLNRTFRVYELLLKHLVEHSSPGKSNHIIQAACQAHSRLDFHFNSLSDKTSYSVSLAMDPRLKYSFWRDTLDDYNKASRCINDVESIWTSEFKLNTKDETESSQPDIFESFFSYNRKRVQDDLERYIAEDLADNDLLASYPELDYWRKSSEKYRNLWPMARKYLSIPATASPCEYTFSNLELIIPEYLHQLRPSEIRESLLLESWLSQVCT